MRIPLTEGEKLVCPLSNDNEFRITKLNSDAELKVSFHRTLRVPDDEGVYPLPPTFGRFPLMPVAAYREKLPASMVEYGGAFIPMYQREAMWIGFEANTRFAVKMHVGGVNVISGEFFKEDEGTRERRVATLKRGRCIQDYVVAPHQCWIDGFCHSPGEVRQFVAMPFGSGYSGESQITGRERVGGIQFDVWSWKPLDTAESAQTTLYVKTLTQRTMQIRISLDADVYELKQALHAQHDFTAPRSKLIFRSSLLEDWRSLRSYGISTDDVIHLLLGLWGGGHDGAPPVQMSVAAGGRIGQNMALDRTSSSRWDRDSHVSFNVQIVNSLVYSQVVGSPPPESPINASTYAEAGLPFYKLYDEPSEISGDFSAVRSVKALDKKRAERHGSTFQPDKSIEPVVIPLYHHNALSPFRPWEELAKEVTDWETASKESNWSSTTLGAGNE